MWQISAGLTLALALTGGAFKLYIDKAEAEKTAMALELHQAAENQLTLESTITTQNANILSQKKRTEEVLLRIERLDREGREALEEVNAIRKKFARHNLSALSIRKPLLIQKIVNKGTAEVLNDLETITTPTL